MAKKSSTTPNLTAPAAQTDPLAEIDAVDAVDAVDAADAADAADNEARILERVRAGLTRAQAAQVIAAQTEHDAELAKQAAA